MSQRTEAGVRLQTDYGSIRATGVGDHRDVALLVDSYSARSGGGARTGRDGHSFNDRKVCAVRNDAGAVDHVESIAPRSGEERRWNGCVDFTRAQKSGGNGLGIQTDDRTGIKTRTQNSNSDSAWSSATGGDGGLG